MSKAPNKLEITTWIKNGKFTTNTEIIKDFCKAWNDCLITVTLHKKRNKRSNPQNSYYWSVIIPILQNGFKVEWGEIHTKQEVHEFLLTNFNFEEIVIEETGEILRKVRRSKDNDTKQQEDYHSKCRQFIKEYFNVDVPLPEKQVKVSFD
jgi:hypothetical protein